MLTAEEDGKPVLFPIELFYELTGEYPQKDEMNFELGLSTFECLYRSWITWHTDGGDCSICSAVKSEV